MFLLELALSSLDSSVNLVAETKDVLIINAETLTNPKRQIKIRNEVSLSRHFTQV